MRVTNKLMADTVSRNLNRNLAQILEIQEKVSSGKRINKPSDDPIGAGNILNYNKILSQIGQYERNIAHGEAWLEMTESTLGSVNELVIRAKELATYQSSETASAQSRAAVAEEVDALYEELIRLGNTRFGESYIFAGFQVDTAPFAEQDLPAVRSQGVDGAVFTLDTSEVWSLEVGNDTFSVAVSAGDSLSNVADKIRAAAGEVVQVEIVSDEPPGSGDRIVISLDPGQSAATVEVNGNSGNLVFEPAETGATHTAYQGDRGAIQINMGRDLGLTINLNGDTVLTGAGDPGGVNLFDVLQDLKQALEDNDTQGIDAQIGRLDQALNQVLEARSKTGARLNRLEMAGTYWADFKTSTTELLSRTEDADMVETMTQLSIQETVYEASLSATGRMLQQTLLDFLK